MNIHIENKRLIKKNNKAIKTMIDLYNEKVELQDENKQLKNDLLRAEAMEDYWKINSSELEDENKKLHNEKEIINNKLMSQLENNKEYKNQRDDMMFNLRKLHRAKWNLEDEKTKLSDELTLKIRHNHIQSLEINELKQELKEYRGF